MNSFHMEPTFNFWNQIHPPFHKVGDIHNPPTSRAITIMLLLYSWGGRYATQVALRVDIQNLLPRDY
jgi:hypothetical protein